MTETVKTRADWLPPVFALLFCAWLFGVPALFLKAAFSVPFTVAAVGLPLLGLAVAAFTRRKVTAIVFAVALLPSVVVLGYDWAKSVHDRPGHTICREHAVCPGD